MTSEIALLKLILKTLKSIEAELKGGAESP